MPTQSEAGKAFEFAILQQSSEYLSGRHHVNVQKDNSFNIAERCFNLFKTKEKENYQKAAIVAIKHITELEPRLINPISERDILTLQIVPDSEGIGGDVRDVLFIRSSQEWEIGISAKNNHKAIKHSRLSDRINFGKEWLDLNCNEIYFNSIHPIFSELRQIKTSGELWRNLNEKQSRFYIPILEAFCVELKRLDRENPTIVPARLLSYLIGNKDFYKVIKRRNKTEIYGFHLHGSLNKASNKLKPKFKVPSLKLPKRIIELTFKAHSKDTVILTCDEGWQISFRIHNASSEVEPSLKFDINLIGQPQTLYSNHLSWD